jgi:enediyne biosynthesis protein E4
MRLILLASIFLTTACADKIADKPQPIQGLFTLLAPAETGINFENKLTPQEGFDVFRYRNYYNGGGVAIGDINNDGLADIYFTSNMEKNKLYLNKGGWKFEDITNKAGVGGGKVWSTGVSMVDVNADGFLDIYVCNSGDISGGKRENELFINNGDLTFTERAAEFGLDDRGFSTHTVFFDYDKDGDLDCYILNNSFKPIGLLGYKNVRDQRDELGGDKLMKNDDGVFHDVSEKAGIYGSVIGFGLGVTVGDVNNDNWPDIYISNDFYERDYLYINNHDGTFKEKLEEYVGHLSMFSMGADIADINNDGYLDIFSTDMLPEDDERLKKLTAFEAYDVYQIRLQNEFYHQFMRNMLQLNSGDGSFVEVGQLAGVNATDWSWGALITDFNNDGNKELFVCNGIYKDVTDQDFIEYMGSNEKIRDAFEGKKINFSEFVNGMTSTKLKNYLFERDSLMHFKNVSASWGLDQPGFSNGAAYGDLDNDGDLDLVVNNLNMPSFVYRNDQSVQKNNSSISINFKGDKKNSYGIGAKVKTYSSQGINYYEHMPMRGFQSSMDYKLVIGLGSAKVIDSMEVVWPDDRVQMLKHVNANQLIQVDIANASLSKAVRNKSNANPLLKELAAPPFAHQENEYNDFNRERLIFNMLSTQGPALATGDINKDGLDDFYIGGARGQSGVLMMQKSDGNFDKAIVPVFLTDSTSEDVDAIFFDADNDKDLDLYVVTGGSEFANQSKELADHLYLNQTVGNKIVFAKSNGLPAIFQVGGCVTASDIDHDGDQDLFVGTRVVAGYYGTPPRQFLLMNDGKGIFSEASTTWYNSFANLGMVTDAEWIDLDGDGWDDLIMVGEWMPITVLKNDGKKLATVTNPTLQNSNGWWNAVHVTDLNKDGLPDVVLGNLGWNSRFRPTEKDPVDLFVSDFDGNGSIDPVYTYRKDGKDFPFALRQDMLKQMPSLKKKFLYYKDYAGKSIDQIFSPDQLKKASVLSFSDASTKILLNKGNFNFESKNLPWQSQVSPVYGLASTDLNNDGNIDLIVGGNFFWAKPEVGRYDGLDGLVLLGDGKGNFSPLSSQKSGLKVKGETRRIAMLRSKKGLEIVFARNNESLKLFGIWK